MKTFLEIPHDSQIEEIRINRMNPGIKDEILFGLLIEGDKWNLIFKDVYRADFKMNYGIISEETIRYVEVFENDSELTNVKEEWAKINVDINKLACYIINTNSTNSLFKIFACSYTMEKYG